MQVRGSKDQVARLPVQERLGVELGSSGTATIVLRVDPAWRCRVADVEQGELHAGLAAPGPRRWADAGVQRALPDTKQQVLPDWVQVARVAGDLQFTYHLRRCRVAKIENVE